MKGWKISADTGGTFTDCLFQGPDGSLRRGKVLSSGCLRTQVTAIGEGGLVRIHALDCEETGWLEGCPVRIDGRPAGRLRRLHGGELFVESLPEEARAGHILEIDSGLEAPVLAMRLLFPGSARNECTDLSFRLGTTKGTNALLENKGAPTALFVTSGFEDLLLIRDQKRPDLFARAIDRPEPLYERVYGVPGRIGTGGGVLEPIDPEALRERAEAALAGGCEVAAVCLLNSWTNPAHEEAAGGILREAGFQTVRLSSRIRPLIKYLDRTDTTLVDATLSPVMDTYLDRVQAELGDHPLWIMTSAGGLVSRSRFHAVDSLVSGPAGGVLGAVAAGRRAGMERIIGLDMGGTSTDVSRWRKRVELRQQVRVGEARLLTPAMPIETVAAGGGSICGYDGELLFVGPESSGADPGPACYGAGGPLSLTDIHLLLGRVDPNGFAIPIRIEAARKAIQEVAEQAGERDWLSLADGFLKIATERMAHAIRQVSLREGEDPARYGLVAFGGAGGLHACRVADELGMTQVLFPPDAGILSARGIHYAPREAVVEKQLLGKLDRLQPGLDRRFESLREDAWRQLEADGVREDSLDAPLRTVFMRLRGQESAVPVEWDSGKSLATEFRERFVAIFGYFPQDASMEIVKLRLRLVEHCELPEKEQFPGNGNRPEAGGTIDGFLSGQAAAIPVFDRSALRAGDRISGPAILRDPFSTGFVEKGWTAVAGTGGSIRLVLESGENPSRDGKLLGNVEKTLVLNRLEGLVEEMGDQLRRTALSTNIRERLDFSCALLDAQGRLLVNAPHIPVHLGAMGLCLRECVKKLEPGPGDVIITNHPAYGGSHLPDVTVICGLFDDQGQLLGYLANRAHHAELGGKSPGSMPADGKSLEEEGVIIKPQWIIRNGRDRLDDIEALLLKAPYPSRASRENRIDLEAQLAALRRGQELFQSLLRDYAVPVVTGYFNAFHRMGAQALRGVLESGRISPQSVVEELDDGTRICLGVSTRDGKLRLDFTGTSAFHNGNLNATPAIVTSAVLYALRLLVDTPMPLNEGLLEHVEIHLPECFLNPAFPEDPARCPAVVGGNVETSQRVVDSLIQAFDLMAAGQGTMNNFLFGNDRFGYYETVGGGAGAQEGRDGASGVHVHMTNTAITDPEILEQRFPVLCREFSLRKGSGGSGEFRGGDGLVREIRFLEPVTVSLLSQNRARGPAGRHGGGDGSSGRQWIIRDSGKAEPLDGAARVELQSGDAVRLETPGGGGWGNPRS